MEISSMKLNLGCGQDIRIGYVNIDLINGDNITKGDFKNLDALGIQDSSVEEITAIDAIQSIPFKMIAGVLQNWAKKLVSGGKLILESWDYNVLGNLVAYDYIPVDQLNQILYGDQNALGIYNLVGIESYLKEIGLKTESKGLRDKDGKFFLVMSK